MSASSLDFRLLLLPVISLPMGFVTLALAARAWREHRQVSATRNWSCVPGMVIASSVQKVNTPVRVRTSTGQYRLATRYAPILLYEYTVNGARYRARRLRLGARILSSEASDAEQEIRRYPINSVVMVWYDPANPAEATLKMRTGWGTWAQWLASGMMLAMTLLATFFISR